MSSMADLWRASSSAVRRVARLEGAFLVLVVLAMFVLFTFTSPDGAFLSYRNLRNIALDTSEIVILAAGEAFIIIAAGLDLSIGSMVIFCAVVSGKVMVAVSGSPEQVVADIYPRLGLGIVAGLATALLAGLAWGFFNGYVHQRWGVPPFIVTLGTLGMALGLAQVISRGVNVANVPTQIQTSFGAAEMFGAIPWLVVVAAAVVAILWVVLAQTGYGLRTYAIGSNLEAARRAGINVRWHVISLYVLMGLLAGVVGFMDLARFSTATVFGHTQDNLLAIAAVVIGGVSLFGGRGKMSGVILGAFIPTILRNGFILMGVQPYWQNVTIGAFLIVAVYVDQARRSRARVSFERDEGPGRGKGKRLHAPAAEGGGDVEELPLSTGSRSEDP